MMPCSIVSRPLSPETPSELWVPRRPELRWFDHFRFTHPRPRCPVLRCSGHFRLRHPRNSDFNDALLHS
eukprot:5836504-Pyramimonas_sp.AAC.1